ncbi:unnamed protein product [Aureobasidium uvarum]|uniref:DUF1772-domain-containing protein n=1 Tax=Aureobasidium uvarum TaxID=2773716 RepID=A0A9N8KL98_9PEZI|nr:unnamed protein product [Aureobasidium uvarum]
MDTSTAISTAKVLGPTISLATAGVILSLSAFYTPLLSSSARSQSSEKPSPSSTLPAIRFIFSRGSHTIPQAAALAAANFGFLAYHAPSTVAKVLGMEIGSRAGFIAAGVLSMAIGPITGIMLPICNNPLREMAEIERQGKGSQIDEGKLKEMVKKFEWLNYVRGAVILAGGMLGLAVIVG